MAIVRMRRWDAMGQNPRDRLERWGGSTNREEARVYVQERLALFARLVLWISVVVGASVAVLYGLHAPEVPQLAWLLVVTGTIGQATWAAVWYFALHRRRLTLEQLAVVDAALAMLMGIQLGIAGYVVAHRFAVIYAGLIYVVFARTIVVPSSGPRTLAIAAASFVPLLLSAIAIAIQNDPRLDLPRLSFVAATVFCSVVTVVLATTGSRVIYGLRKQVSQAMQLGQYTLEAKIGEGGMGAVHRARHAMLRRPTAIKLLPPDRYDERSLQRFEREVQHMSRLTHPNTVSVFDYGRSPDGIFYYAMEFLDGIDLETLVAVDGPQPAARVVYILHQICGALDEAHTMGLIHRDIKPANVILCRRGGQPDIAKVVDFGLVEEVAHASQDASRQSIVGTPAYVSPEAVTDPDRVGPRSDLYALGASAYFLLTGARVFEARDPVALCSLHVTTQPVPPSQRTSNRIPADLETLVMCCLSKDPEARPRSAHDLRLALSALPVFEEWDEAASLEWWRDFDGRRRTATPAEKGIPLATITVDVATRTDVDQDIGR